jgi:cysteine sulfinate desulfinase/cysteine desulfurase-like protein
MCQTISNARFMMHVCKQMLLWGGGLESNIRSGSEETPLRWAINEAVFAHALNQ